MNTPEEILHLPLSHPQWQLHFIVNEFSFELFGNTATFNSVVCRFDLFHQISKMNLEITFVH